MKNIYKDKVYTSSYKCVDEKLLKKLIVPISRTVPAKYKKEERSLLEPPYWLVHEFKDADSIMSEEEFEYHYREEVLDKLSPEEIYEKMKGKVLVCYEGKSKFCHRRIVTKWLEETLGEGVVGGEI